MPRYALVDTSGIVDNVIMWDGAEGWEPPQGFTAVQSESAEMGWTYANGVFSEPATQPVVLTLAEAQTTQIALIDSEYASAVAQPISYTSKGAVTKAFQADGVSQTLLMQSVQGYTLAGAVPSGFYWVSADNTQVPFTLADISGLYQAMLAQGWEAFQKKQTLRAQINAITDATPDAVASVQAINW